MKKTTLLIISIILSYGAYAQIESHRAVQSKVGTNGIVRGVPGSPEMVTYCEYNHVGHFMLTGAPPPLHPFPIDSTWHILDFRIIYSNNIHYVVFCGTVTHTYPDTVPALNGQSYQVNDVQYTVGLIGYFNLSGLYGTSMIFQAIEDSSVTKFTKVATLCDTDYLYAIGDSVRYVPHIVNGDTAGYYSYSKSCLYKIETWHSFFQNYYTYPDPTVYVTKYYANKVDLTDISATPHYVTAVGDFADATGKGLCLIRYGTNDASAGDAYRYYTIDEPLSDYHSIGFDDKDYLMAACLAVKDDNYWTSIRCVDLNSMHMFNAQQMKLANKAEPSELAYVKTDASVVMQIYLHNAFPPNPSIIETFHFRIDPYNMSNYNSTGFYYPGGYHSTVCCVDDKYAAAFNGQQWLLKDMLQGYNNTCYLYGSNYVETQEPLEPEPFDCLYEAPVKIKKLMNMKDNISVDCGQYCTNP